MTSPTDRRTVAQLVDRLRAEGRLREVVAAADAGSRSVPGDVTGIADDSRRVEPGNLFVAVRGLRVDGHDFVGQAVERGAAAVVVESAQRGLAVRQLVVDRGAASLASSAAWWHGDPSRELQIGRASCRERV